MAQPPNSDHHAEHSDETSRGRGHADEAHESGADTSRPPVDMPGTTPPPPPPGYTPPPPGHQPAPRQQGVLHRLAISLVTTVLLISLVLNVYFALLIYGQFGGGPHEEVYREGDAAQRMVILPLSGIITANMAENVRRSLKKLDKDPPKALIVRVSSGGGGVTASDHIWHSIQKFQKDHKDVPVVASYGGTAASGGYYASVLSDWIVAEPTTTTGSIGVLAEVPTVEKLMDKIGVKWVTLEADGSPYKERANNPFRTWDEDDIKVVKGLLNHAYEKFVDVVHEGRTTAKGKSKGITRKEVLKFAKGQVFTADEAKAKHVIDQIGYLQEAFAKAKALANIDKDITPQVTRISVSSPLGWLSFLTGRFHSPGRTQAALPTDPRQVRQWITQTTDLKIEYRMSLH